MKNKIVLISLLLFTFAISGLYAQKEPVYLNMLAGDSIYTGNRLVVKDSVYYDPGLKPTIEHTYFINNIVSLRINEYSGKMMPDSFTLTLGIRVIYGTSETTYDSVEKVLHVNYNKLKNYNDKSIFLFNTAHYVEVKILTMSSYYADTSDIIPHLLLENRMVIERNYLVQCTNDAIGVISLDTTSIAGEGEIKIFWTPNQVSQMYDVEWTYLDRSALDNGRYDNQHGNLDPALIFRNNATRITTRADTCMIPLLYDGEGSLFYRIRGTKIDQTGEIQATKWSSEMDTLAANWSFDFTGHERDLNWQASTSFAEEGKRKSVVQYFDGSLRSRQVVTRDNTTMTTVVAETLYDKQGRPSIQVLPAPTLNKIIGYTPFFNVRDMNSAEYDKGVYDTLFSSDDYCSSQADSFSVVSGAARYYSEQNPINGVGYHRFIAQDSGFIFTQTQYTQDNTGRVYRQGGVGKQFQLGTEKETRYYYGTPDQEHLDALFGTEAGYAAHYQKNMVRDPNGQYSVSYVDMHGRTIATALAGAAPGSLDTIISYRRDSLETVQMLSPLSNLLNGDAVAFTKTIFMTKRDSVWLNYSMSTQGLTLKDCQDNNICYSCLYDLTISVVGECGSSVSGRNDTVIRLTNFPLWQVDTVCGLAQPVNITIPLILDEGSYVINKTLRISEEGRTKYRDSVYMPHNTCKSFDDFYNEQLQIAKDSMSCSTDSVSRHMYLHYREQMMADLYPLTGQYADTAKSRSCFSIFNRRVWGPHKRLYVLVADTGIYRNEAGLPDSVLNSNGEMVPPQLLTIDEFISNFKNSWAENLLSLHPEYCYLELYESLAGSHIWDEDFEKTDKYQEAIAKGYLNPVNSALSPASSFSNTTDPLYGYSFGTTAKIAITDSLFKAMPLAAGTPPASYATVWGLATAVAKCGDTLSAGGLWYWNQAAKNFSTTDLCEGELDMAWRIFRGVYLEKKREWIDGYIRSKCTFWPYPQLPCQPVFPMRDSVLSSAGYAADAGAQNHTTGLAQADSIYAANCDSYISWWRQKLGNCYTESQKDVLTAQMTLVCKEGADASHSNGASSIKPSSTHVFQSFDAVFKFYKGLWGVTDTLCNAFLIDKPLPYGRQMPLYDKEIWNKPDSCTCAKVDSLYNAYSTSYTIDFPSFASYLKAAVGVDISTSHADTLRKICDGTITCKFLPQPIKIPARLQCGYTLPSCTDCEVFSIANDSFRTRYPGVVPSLANNDSLVQLKNELYKNFMNQWFGFNKEWYEYADFQTYCESVGVIRPTCDTLAKYWAEYYSQPQLPDPACTQFVQYFNDRVGLSYTKFQIDSIYATCGITISWCDTIPISASQLATIRDAVDCQWYSLEYPAVDTGQCNLSPWTYSTVINGQLEFFSTRPAVDTLIQNGVFRNVHRPGSTLQYARWTYSSQRGFKVDNEYAFEIRMRQNYVDAFKSRVEMNFYNRSIDQPGYATDEDFGVVLCNQEGLGRYSIRGVSQYTSVLDSLDFVNWHTYKYQVLPDRFELYYDGTKLLSVPRDGNSYIEAVNGNNFVFSPGYTDSIELDYITIFGSNGDTIMHEDFDRSNALFTPASDTSYYLPKPDCRTFRKNLFNALAGKNWTIEQITYYGKNVLGSFFGTTCTDPMRTLCNNDSLSVELANEPCTDTAATAITAAMQLYEVYRDSLINAFNDAYNKKCLKTASLESFTITKPQSEYHYTLYYYDLAGNLIKTVPPAGVKPNRSQAWLDQVDAARESGQHLAINHELPTVYRYNSLNQVVSQQSPDGGLSKFWYDRLGRLVVSQNEKQLNQNDFSYTKYDAIGRITEVGQKKSFEITQSISRNPVSLTNWLNYKNFNTQYWPAQVTSTHYDLPSPYASVYLGLTPFRQKEYTLRNRVSRVTNYDKLYIGMSINGSDTTYTPDYNYFNTGIEYSYDIHGNVDTLLNIASVSTLPENFGTQAYKYIAYKYDLISGKVNEVHYNAGFADEFYHRYEYDADNRLTDVYTTEYKALLFQAGLEEHDAHYQYYKHGPLARMVLGQQQVQGLDYAYTLQGWLKGVNSTALNPDYDMGEDGNTGAHSFVGRDAFSFQLNYFNNDYRSISPDVRPFAGHSAYLTTRQLYNGNISSMAVNIGKFEQPQLYNYSYDQLNRITGMDVHRGLNTTDNLWTSALGTALEDYKERISYDGNGNILSYLRNGLEHTEFMMDELSYHYYPGSNRLSYVTDEYDAEAYTVDIDNQEENNYVYDEIGNLIHDQQAGLGIDWNVYGKISFISRQPENESDVQEIYYRYDPSGNRVEKQVIFHNDPQYYSKTDWYVRDAQGNVMAVYRAHTDESSQLLSYNLVEHHMYGSSRLGVMQRDHDMSRHKGTSVNANLIGKTYLYKTTRGLKSFELSNHLGNVLVTVSDKKQGIDTTSDGFIDQYQADVVTANDYYPFGMLMPDRKYSASDSYRYGFNGKENDNEVKGDGNRQDYGMRIYDTRLGKFLSVDPFTKGYAMLTPYQFATNSPIAGIDLDGLEFYYTADGKLHDHKTTTFSTKQPIPDNISNQLRVAYNFKNADKYVTFSYQMFHQASEEVRNKIISTIYQSHISGKVPPELTTYDDGQSRVAGSTARDKSKMNLDASTKWKGEYLFDNFYNLINVTYHESLHFNSIGQSSDGFSHYQIFKKQVAHSSWEKTTDNFKSYQSEAAAGYIEDMESLNFGLATFVNKNPNRKTVYKSKQDELSFNYYYDEYKTAVEHFNKTFSQKRAVKSKDQFLKPIEVKKNH